MGYKGDSRVTIYLCKKPIAGYDNEKKQAYVEYANGKRKYVNIENL